MIKTLNLNGREIEYELIKKRVKNINLRIGNDGVVRVSCPYYVASSEAEAFVKSNTAFILKALSDVAKRKENASRPAFYEDGEKVNVFGERCTLRVSPLYSFQGLKYEYPDIFVNASSLEETFKIYERWRRGMLRSKVIEMVDFYMPLFYKYNVKYPSKIVFRAMKSRWGVCMPSKGQLTFNYNLFEVPEELIAYVVVHELCHFIEANHSDRFWALVEVIMPDYKIRRKALREY